MIVIGGSLGGFAAVNEILHRLPADFSLPIAIVLHRHRDSEGLLLPVLRPGCLLPASEVEDKDPIEPGHVYLCPPDYHLLFDEGCFSLSTDDPLNFARPSIDAFFESAAEWKGRSVIAVVLSGAGSDGASGAKTILENGGLVIAQDPATADGAWMPNATIAATKTRHVMRLEHIADVLIRVARRRSHRTNSSEQDRKTTSRKA